MKKINLLIIIVSIIQITFAQNYRAYTNNNNAWIIYNGNFNLSKKLMVTIEYQERRYKLGKENLQHLFRPYLSYNINSNVQIGGGYCFVETYPYGAFPVKTNFPESRFFEQIVLKNKYTGWEWISRYRVENRWQKLPVYSQNEWTPGPKVFTNRMRILNRFNFTLPKKWNKMYVYAADELFINAGKNIKYNLVDQNRLMVGCGYAFSPNRKLEIGYLEQTVIKSSGTQMENNHTLQVSFNMNVNLFSAKNK